MNRHSVTGHCPGFDELWLLLIGRLPTTRAETVSEHVVTCADCQNQVALLPVITDPLVAALAGVQRADLQEASTEMDVVRTHAVNPPMVESTATKGHEFDTTLNLPCTVGPYYVTQLIGRGGMGEVYLARHTRLDRLVALKVIDDRHRNDTRCSERFLHEMAIAGRFDHPNLVRAYDAWEDNGCRYLCMELLDGMSVAEICHKGGLSVSDVLFLMEGICKALVYIHSRGCVHRDVKPSNIIRRTDGTVKLIDFGLAFTTGGASAGIPKAGGTVGYMSPEQFSGGEVDHRSDIYSCGRVLLKLIRSVNTESLSRKDRWRTGRLVQIANRMTKVDPEERYQRMSHVMSDLRKLFRSRPAPLSKGRRGTLFLLFVAAAVAIVVRATGQWLLQPGYSLHNARIARFRTDDRRTALHRYPDSAVFTNFAGIAFGRVTIPAKHSGRRDTGSPGTVYLSLHEVSMGTYRQVTGQIPEGFVVHQDDHLPVTHVSMEEAAAFCERLSRHDPDGLVYRIPDIEVVSAVSGRPYDSAHLTAAAGQRSHHLISVFRNLSTAHFSGLNSDVWEWTASVAPLGNVPIVRNSNGMSGGKSRYYIQRGAPPDIFLDAFDINDGSARVFDSITGLRLYVEPDKVTKYLCPVRRGIMGYAVCRYEFEHPVLRASVKNCFHLFSKSAQCEVSIATEEGSPSWTTVYSGSGRGYHDSPVDVTALVSGRTWFLVRYGVRTEDSPLHYAQLGRTTPSPQFASPNVFQVQAETSRGISTDQGSQTLLAPAAFRHRRLGFRIMIPARRHLEKHGDVPPD